jgi:mannose-6-phosphate isomerase
MSQIFELECKAQNYEWGKVGSSSKVAQLNSGNDSVDEQKPYAEVSFSKLFR